MAEALQITKSQLGACIDGVPADTTVPDHDRFTNYQPVEGHDITTVNGCTLKVIGMGDIHIELPNRSK